MVKCISLFMLLYLFILLIFPNCLGKDIFYINDLKNLTSSFYCIDDKSPLISGNVEKRFENHKDGVKKICLFRNVCLNAYPDGKYYAKSDGSSASWDSPPDPAYANLTVFRSPNNSDSLLPLGEFNVYITRPPYLCENTNDCSYTTIREEIDYVPVGSIMINHRVGLVHDFWTNNVCDRTIYFFYYY